MIPTAPVIKSNDKPRAKPQRPTIIQLNERVSRLEGIEALTPHWEATLRGFYALPLRDEDIVILCKVTKRSRPFWEARRGGRGTNIGDGLTAAHDRKGIDENDVGKPVIPFRELWARVGRRGRKSSTIGLLVTFEALFGGHEKYLMRGESGRVNILSHSKDGATVLTQFIQTFCEALGIKTGVTTTGVGKESRKLISIEGSRLTVAIVPANIRATRGFAAPVNVFDEFAFVGGDESANSDKEVMAAATPSMAQFKKTSRKIVLSSPFGEVGLFHEVIEANLGDDDPTGSKHRSKRILAVEGPSWEWGNISEAETHELERDPDVHAREYGAIPSGAEGTAFVRKHVAAAFKPPAGLTNLGPGDPLPWDMGRNFMVIDASGGGNTFACAVVSCGKPGVSRIVKKFRTPDGTIIVLRDKQGEIMYEDPPKKSVVFVHNVFGFTSKDIEAAGGTGPIVAQLAEVARAHDCSYIFGDQYGAAFLGPLLGMHKAELRFFAHSSQSKHEAVLTMRWLMRDGMFWVTDHDKMKTDLSTYPRRVAGARFVYGNTPGKSHHHDYASAIVTLGHVFNGISLNGGYMGRDQAGSEYHIQNAPTRKGVGKTVTVPESSLSSEE